MKIAFLAFMPQSRQNFDILNMRFSYVRILSDCLEVPNAINKAHYCLEVKQKCEGVFCVLIAFILGWLFLK